MTESTFLIDKFIVTTPGDPIRLFPLGRLVKGGKERLLTKEYMARFKLPHFQPPMKLGSHKDTTPAGGHFTRLEVRDDGLYGHVNLNPKGTQAIIDGHFKYESPEVIWDDGALEHPQTGELIEGPLIVGMALLHTPHLGELAAVYSVDEKFTGGNRMSENTVQVPVSLFDRMAQAFGRGQDAPEPTPVPTAQTLDSGFTSAEYTAIQVERDEFKATIATMEAQAAQAARVTHFASELNDTALADNVDMHGLLAGLTDEQAEPIVVQFKALSAQINESALVGDVGGQKPAGVDMGSLDSVVKARMATDKVDYNTALIRVGTDRPDFAALYRGN